MNSQRIRLALLVLCSLILAISIGALAFKLVFSADGQASGPIASSSTMPARWSATFSGGENVELLGIQEDPSIDGKWWGGDGLEVPSPQAGEPRSNVQGDIGTRTVRFILRGRASADRRRDVTVQVVPSTITRDSGYGADRIEVLAAVPAEAATAELRVGLGAGPWTDDLTYDVATGQLTSSADATLKMSDIALADEGNETLLQFTWMGQRDPSRQVRVVLSAGAKELQMSHGSESSGDAKYYYKSTRKDVSKLILQSRAYEMLSMKDLSLRPTTKPAR